MEVVHTESLFNRSSESERPRCSAQLQSVIVKNQTEKPVNRWLKKLHALQEFQIGERRLREWTDQGLIRSVKVGKQKQGRRLYSVADLERVLTDLAAGRTPRRFKVRGHTP
jgi:hypothetical protein